jgi:hypothetical protein
VTLQAAPSDLVPVALAPPVRKHVNAVAIVPADRKIGLLTRKLFTVLLHHAQAQREQETYSVPLREVIALARFDSRDYALLKKSLRQMISTVVEWQSPTEGEFARWEASGLVAGVTLDKDRVSGAITLSWSYAPQVRAQLLSPDRYARLQLEYVAEFRSLAALVLYEVCARYVDNPSHLTARQPWRWWKPVLTGQPQRVDDRSEYRYFKRDVLVPAINEVNAITDLEVSGPIEARGADGKTVTTLQFMVRRKALASGEGPRPSNRLEPVDLPVIGMALRLGLTQEDAEALLGEFGGAALRKGLEQYAHRQQTPGAVAAIAQPARWLRAVLRNLQQRAESFTALASRERTVSPAPQRQARWREEWVKRRRAELVAAFGELDEAERGEWLRRYRQSLEEKRSPLARRYARDGWRHPMVLPDFVRFFAQSFVGPEWDRPTSEELLALAADIGDPLAPSSG